MTALLLAGIGESKAQGKPATSLAGTTWKGTSYVPGPLICALQFNKDTVRLLYVEGPEIMIRDGVGAPRAASGKDSVALETMTYRYSGDTLELHKVSGGSPCGDEKGQYRAQVAGGKLKLIAVQDPCEARPYAFQEEFALVK